MDDLPVFCLRASDGMTDMDHILLKINVIRPKRQYFLWSYAGIQQDPENEWNHFLTMLGSFSFELVLAVPDE